MSNQARGVDKWNTKRKRTTRKKGKRAQQLHAVEVIFFNIVTDDAKFKNRNTTAMNMLLNLKYKRRLFTDALD